ncbi:fimbrial protein [Pseudomonas putida]|uniref:fimbrial protein n=1 Tax=Pseudomonas putida TaxID=303 RepID=UPI0020C4D26E|nr:fimbrial protein [Pseudomonas putida]UTL82536.1 type 1 fimbrial protein [Pseudomonas putida]
MKHGLIFGVSALLLALSYTNSAHAGCRFRTGSGTLDYTLDAGTLWIPRDAPIGTPIGPVDRDTTLTNAAGLELVCYDDGGAPMEAALRPTVPIFPGALPPVNGEDLTGRVLETGVPGIGIHVRLVHPYNNPSAPNAWRPRTWASVPYEGYTNHHTGPLGIVMNVMRTHTTLVKTGPIQSTPIPFNNKQLFIGQYSDVGTALRFSLNGTVKQEQCTLLPYPFSADPVQLGEYPVQDFTGEGYTTPAKPFQITLSDCEIDPISSTAQAYLRFEGVRGSLPIDADRGLFSLTTDSTASGLGIQLLHDDGRPVELNVDVPVKPLEVGVTQLDFRARYLQTDADVSPGRADGALKFTVSYR